MAAVAIAEAVRWVAVLSFLLPLSFPSWRSRTENRVLVCGLPFAFEVLSFTLLSTAIRAIDSEFVHVSVFSFCS